MTVEQATDPALAAAALDQAGDAIIAIDHAGTITLWNQKCTELFGFTAEQAIGEPVEIIIPENLRTAHEHGFGAAMESGHLASDGRARRTKGITADGGKVYVTMTFAVINDAEGTAIGAVAVAREYVKES
ncbi:PAS domain-containing protein [Raineyella antarctica]|nr:PAS domain-containing protein [Raineyella antarctica]